MPRPRQPESFVIEPGGAAAPPPPDMEAWIIDDKAIETVREAYKQVMNVAHAFELVGVPKGVWMEWRRQANRDARNGCVAFSGGFVGQVSMPMRMFAAIDQAKALTSRALIQSLMHKAMPLYDVKPCADCAGSGLDPKNGRKCKPCDGEGRRRQLIRDGDPKTATYLLQVMNKGGEYDVRMTLEPFAAPASSAPVLDVRAMTDEQLLLVIGGEGANPGPNHHDD